VGKYGIASHRKHDHIIRHIHSLCCLDKDTNDQGRYILLLFHINSNYTTFPVCYGCKDTAYHVLSYCFWKLCC
jgi:hypothetical protein